MYIQELVINFKIYIMKKLLLLSFALCFLSCSLDSEDNQVIKLLTIDEAFTPQSFTYKSKDTIKVKYTLPNSCHSFFSLYYQSDGNARIIAIRALEKLNGGCSQQTISKELKIPIQVQQKEDYIFKFWKGKDTNGNDIFEEKTIPVN